MTMTKPAVASISDAGTGYEGQTFLVGDEVYIRTYRIRDHRYATSIRSSVFPKSTALMKKWIREDLPKEGGHQRGHLVIVRKSDDIPVGSVTCEHDDTAVDIQVYVDPLYGDTGARWKAEALRLVASWEVLERHRPIAHTTIAATETIVIEAAQAFGMRECARFREMLVVDGQRVDQVWLEFLNPGWVRTLGDPVDAPLERTGTGQARPVPPVVMLEGDPPKNAMLVGKRVYLRPETKDDAKIVADWVRKETEAFWDIGRHLPSAVRLADWIEKRQEDDRPDGIDFTVCLRVNDEPIGNVALLDVDYVHLNAETASYFHRPDYRGNGYGSEAKQLLLEYAFEVLGLHMVQSWVYFPNTRSAAALRKQGYTHAGQINWLYSHNGRFGNFVVFDFLAREWRAMPRQEWES